MKSAIKYGVAIASLFNANIAESSRINSASRPEIPTTQANRQLRQEFQQDAKAIRFDVDLPPLPNDATIDLRKHNSEREDRKLQVGIARSTKRGSHELGVVPLDWRQPPTGGWVATIRVRSKGAEALRAGIYPQNLSDPTQLRIVGQGQRESVVDVITVQEAKQLTDGQTYWTPITHGDTQLIELWSPIQPETTELEVTAVSHLVASPYESNISAKIIESAPCQIDIACAAQTPALEYARNAVAHMFFQESGATYTCTGTLINDSTSSFTPYFYTANHCLGSQASANTLLTFWFDERIGCGSGGASPRRYQLSGGAAILVADSTTDAQLIRLYKFPPDGAVFSGWDPSSVNSGTPVTVIHHPRGDFKKISTGFSTGYDSFNGLGSYIRVGYTNGVTESGSSGSGLLVLSGDEYYLKGGLRGGSSSCGNVGNPNNPGNVDSFSRIDQAYFLMFPHVNPVFDTPNLVVTKSGDGFGRVSSTPLGIDCGINCAATVNRGAQYTLTALPSAGSTFSGWYGCNSVSGTTCTVIVNSSKNIIAYFSEPRVPGVDEPQVASFPLPTPVPQDPNCPGGFFIASATDGPGTGITPGVFGLELALNAPGTRLLAGGLNFGGLIDVSQPGFAGFNFANDLNETQRVYISVTGSPASSANGTLPVRIRIDRRPDANTSINVFDTRANLTLNFPYTTYVDLAPGFYSASISATQGAAGGSPEGQFFFGMTTSFIGRVGGGFQGGAVVGGYHAAHPFGGVSGFAAFCLATPHAAGARVLSAPSYGSSGARDMRLQLLDANRTILLQVPN